MTDSHAPTQLPGEFAAPEGVVIDGDGNIYTSEARGTDDGRGVIHRLRPGAQNWEPWGAACDDSHVLGLAVDEDFIFAVAPRHRGGSLLRYRRSSDHAECEAIDCELAPEGLLNGVAVFGREVYVSDAGGVPGVSDGRIMRITLDARRRAIRMKTFAQIQFPNGLVPSADGKYLYVAQSGRWGVMGGGLMVFERTSGKLLKSWSLGGNPDGVALDPQSGRLYVALQKAGAILAVRESAIRPDGKPLKRLPAPWPPAVRNESEPDGAWNPAAVAVTAEGDVIFTDVGRGRKWFDPLLFSRKRKPEHRHLWKVPAATFEPGAAPPDRSR